MKRRKTHEHVVVVIEVVDGREGFTGRLCRREVGFCVRGCDYGKGAAEGGFDFGVEMVAGGWGRGLVLGGWGCLGWGWGRWMDG
jgi:hypothetical protein